MTGLRWLPPSTPPGTPLGTATAKLDCPNCAAKTVRRPVLEATPPAGPALLLLACDSCGACFFENLLGGDYAAEAPGGDAALAFYLQQGADMGGMAMRLAALGRPAGTRYLEIGCGFGLGLDFARRGLGWEVEGLDPSPFAAAGRALLGLPIAPRYLLPGDPPGTGFDVVHGSEVLEHVADPQALLRTLSAALRPDGTLLLTTPAAEAIRPETSAGLLTPLLSVGWHMVIQSAVSLELLLRRAGFAAVSVTRHGTQLTALAGVLPPPSPTDRSIYRRWLGAAAGAVPAGSDLGIGLNARLYRECTGASLPAEPVWQALNAAVTGRFGQPLAQWCGKPATTSQRLTELTAAEPLCLAGVLLHRGLAAQQQGEAAAPWLTGAIAAAARLRDALRPIGADDGDAEDVAFAATKELILADARQGAAGIAERIAALRLAGGGKHADAAARLGFLALVNAGHLVAARELVAVVAPARRAVTGPGPLAHEDASVAYCGAVLELQSADGQRQAAVDGLLALRAALLRDTAAGAAGSAAILYWPATEAAALGLRLLAREPAAAALLAQARAEAAPFAGLLSSTAA